MSQRTNKENLGVCPGVLTGVKIYRKLSHASVPPAFRLKAFLNSNEAHMRRLCRCLYSLLRFSLDCELNAHYCPGIQKTDFRHSCCFTKRILSIESDINSAYFSNHESCLFFGHLIDELTDLVILNFIRIFVIVQPVPFCPYSTLDVIATELEAEYLKQILDQNYFHQLKLIEWKKLMSICDSMHSHINYWTADMTNAEEKIINLKTLKSSIELCDRFENFDYCSKQTASLIEMSQLNETEHQLSAYTVDALLMLVIAKERVELLSSQLKSVNSLALLKINSALSTL